MLRIALVAPPWFPVPPPRYGGTERVVAYLADGLVARGHQVTLFASGDSRTAARLSSTFPCAPSAEIGDLSIEVAHVLPAYRRLDEFDIIHDHTTTGLLPAALSPRPVVHTLHGRVTTGLATLLPALPPNIHLVAISHHQRSTLPPGVEARVIHNGIDASRVAFTPTPGDYLLFVGRMSPEKGVVDAIEIARRARLPLRIFAKVNEIPEREYFDSVVRPAMVGVDVDLQMQVPDEEKQAAYAGALATLFPIRWPEPFGLVMIESMATGTPVIAYRHGAAPEVIDHGVTGFVCDTLDEAVAAVDRARDLDRAACRAHVETNFSTARAVALHEQLYREVLAGGAPNERSSQPEE